MTDVLGSLARPVQPGVGSRGPRSELMRGRRLTGAVTVIRPGQPPELHAIGWDVAVIRRELDRAAAGAGFSFAELVAPFAVGRPTLVDGERRLVLAVTVAVLHARGAVLAAVGEVVGRDRRRVAELAQAGRLVASDRLAA